MLWTIPPTSVLHIPNLSKIASCLPEICDFTNWFSFLVFCFFLFFLLLSHTYKNCYKTRMPYPIALKFGTQKRGIRPLQINSLFPVHRPHRVTASSKCSIIPYSSIIFRLFLHTDGFSKSYPETVAAVLSSQHKLHVCVIFATTKEGTSLSMFLCSLFGCARQIMARKSYNEIMEMDRPPACKYYYYNYCDFAAERHGYKLGCWYKTKLDYKIQQLVC